MLLYNGQGHVELIDHMGSDISVVKAARVSIGKGSKGEEADAKLIRFLMRERHTSPFEHCLLTYSFKVPLFVARQHMRHRTWSFNEISRRYTSEDLAFWSPEKFRAQATRNLQCSNGFIADHDVTMATAAFEQAVEKAVKAYYALLDMGICREQARAVLPQGMMTRYYGTVNLHNLMHFLGLRRGSHAQPEIRVMAEACLELARPLFPVSIEAWEGKS